MKRPVVNLVECLPKTFQYEHGVYVALTPVAANHLQKVGITYSIREDYYSLESMLSLESEYADVFARWIELLDAQLIPLFSRMNALGIAPARLYGYYLQLMLDSFFVRCIEIKAICERFKPGEIRYFHAPQQPQPVDYQLAVKGCDLLKMVVPYMCTTYGIVYRSIEVKSADGCRNSPMMAVSLLERLRKICGQMVKAVRELPSIRVNKSPSALVLFNGWGVEKIVAGWKANNIRCLFRYPKYCWQEHPMFAGSASLRELSTHLDLFDTFFKIPLSALVKDRVDYFVSVVCPNLEAAVGYYLDCFDRERVRYVITNYKINFDDFAIMAVATRSEKTDAIQVIHGYSALQVLFWKYSEQPCNLYVMYDSEVKHYFEAHIFKKDGPSIVLGDTWTQKYRMMRVQRETRVPGRTVLYVPTFIGHRWYRFDCFGYPDMWYFRYQLELFRYFGTVKGMNFVYKPFPMHNAVAQSLLDLINEQGGNITIARGSLQDCMKSADFVITDMASTPLYETVAAGIPTLCLCHRGFRVRPAARTFFGDILQSFSTPHEAVAAVARFLESDTSAYVKEFPLAPRDVFGNVSGFFAQRQQSHD